MTVRVPWTTCSLLELRYVPFRPEDGTERAVLDYLANRLVALARRERRKTLGTGETLSSFAFRRSPCLAAVDVAAIRASQASYLDTLRLVTRVYPFVLINCSLSERVLRGLGLQSYLHENGYILPVFRGVAPDDPLTFAPGSGDVRQLVAGVVRELPVSQMRGARPEDILRRYPGLQIDNGHFQFEPEIVWLGVESDGMQRVLRALYRGQIADLRSEELAQQFDVDVTVLERHVRQSMLFARDEAGRVSLRLREASIMPPLMQEMAQRFESAMVDRGAIDTSHSDYATYPSGFHEYHRVGRVFDARDPYALGLLAYIRQRVANLEFSAVAVVDNGTERALVELIPKVFDGKRVIRIVNYFGKPLVSPFDAIQPGENVLLLVDVVNTGRFLREALTLLKAASSRPVAGVFAFILNWSFDSSTVFGEHLVDPNGAFLFYVRKQLHEVRRANQAEQEERFNVPSAEAFSLFWNAAGRVCDCIRGVTERSVACRPADGRRVTAKSLRTLDLNLRGESGRAAPDDCAFGLFLGREFEDKGVSAVVVPAHAGADAIVAIARRLNPERPVITVRAEDASGEQLESLRGQRDVAIVCTALGIGRSLSQLARTVRHVIGDEAGLHLVALLGRRNVIESSGGIATAYSTDLRAAVSSETVFYRSHLPCYLVEHDMVDREYVETKIRRLGDAGR